MTNMNCPDPNYTDWNKYEYHKECSVALNGLAGKICRQCMFKSWWDTAAYYGTKLDANFTNEGHESRGHIASGDL